MEENGDYDEAIVIFEGLGIYKDSSEKVVECSYLKAVSLYNEGEYQSSLYILEELDRSYKEVDAYTVNATYEVGYNYFNNGNYEKAIESFEKIISIKKSDIYLKESISEVKYLAAKAYVEMNDKVSAIDLLKTIKDYGDASVLLNKYIEEVSDNYVNEERYIKCIELCESVNIYPDNYYLACYEQANAAKAGANYEAALSYYEKVGDYKDSMDSVSVCKNYIKYNNAILKMESGKLSEAVVDFKELGDLENSSKYFELCNAYSKYVGLWKCTKYVIHQTTGKSYNIGTSLSENDLTIQISISKDCEVSCKVNGIDATVSGDILTYHQYYYVKGDTNTFNLSTGERTMQFYDTKGNKSDRYEYTYRKGR